jgi:hypothetical protein
LEQARDAGAATPTPLSPRALFCVFLQRLRKLSTSDVAFEGVDRIFVLYICKSDTSCAQAWTATHKRSSLLSAGDFEFGSNSVSYLKLVW